VKAKIKFKILLKYNYVKVLILIVFICLTNRAVNDQFSFLILSDNPFRNFSIYIIIWLMTLYVCLKTAFINNVYIRVLLAMPILLSTYLNEMFYYLSHDSIAYSDMTNLWLSRAEYK